MTYNHNKNILL